MKSRPSRLMGTLCGFGFSVYLAKGHLDWLPDYVPLAVMIAAGLIYLLTPEVREIARRLLQTEAGRIIHPETKKPATVPRIRWKTLTVPVVVFSLCLVAGAVMTWERSNYFELRANVETTSLFYSPKNSLQVPMMTVILTIRNQSRDPYSVSDFWATIKWKDGTISTMKSAMLVGVTRFTYMDGTVEMMYPEDDLDVKGREPIPAGGRIVGRLCFQDTGVNVYRIQNELPPVEIHFEDVRGKKFSATSNFEPAAMGTNREFPGMRSRFH